MSLFGGNAGAGNLFGGNNNVTAKPAGQGGLFDRITPNTSGGQAGAATTSAQQGNNMFSGGLGGGAQQPAASGGGLFGGLGATSKPAATSAGGGGLFGNPGATSQPAAGGNLFGGGATSKPATPNLFGGANAQPASSAPANNSLFGAQNQGNNSLFGATMNPAQNQNQQVVVPDAVPANPSYFDQLLERGKKRQTEEHLTPFGELPALELGLADISRKVRNLGQGGPSAGLARGGDARAHYLLSASGVNTSQALRDLEKLADEHSTQPALSERVADAVTGVKFDLARKHHDDFQALVDSRVKRAQDDFNAMIDEQLYGVDWAAHNQRIYEHFGLKKPQELENGGRESFGATGNGGFGRTGRRSRFGGTTTNGKSFGVPGLNRSVIGIPGPKGARQSQFGDVAEKVQAEGGMRIATEDRVLRLKQEKYIERVKDLNVARLQDKGYPVFEKFATVETEPSGEDTSMLVHAYRALAQIVGEDSSKDNLAETGAIKPRQFVHDYLKEMATAKGPIAIRKRIIAGSRSFLENLYLSQVEATVLKSPHEANVGGVPTSLAKVKGFARVRAARKELGPDLELLQQVGEDYCWVLLYYLMRCGLANDALAYVEDNQAAFRNIDRRFVSYLRAYVQSPDRRLPPQSQTDINNDYSQRSKLAPEDSIDPYRMLCYKIIGRCDLNRRNFDNVNSDMMDWLWLQFALAREYNRVDEFAHEAYGLEELRSSIKDIGDRYFGQNSDVPNAPTTFFFMQTLAGMFEKAIADLYVHNYVSAVHFAIALDYYGLLRVSDISNSEDLLTTTTRQQAQIAFGTMVGLYTRDFRTADPTAGVDYIALICLNADLDGDLGKAQRELCHQALTELVLETRDFASLLGDIRNDGQRIPGSVENRLSLIGLEDERDFMRHITLVAARTADDQSRTTDAALLFHLAHDYDKVLSIINQAVSMALTTELGEQPQKLTPLKPRQQDSQQPNQQAQGSLSLTAVDDPVRLAQNFRSLYFSSQQYFSRINDTTRDACNVLLHLATARQALEAGDWTSAVDVSACNPFHSATTSTNHFTVHPPSRGPAHSNRPHQHRQHDRHPRQGVVL